MKRPQKPRDTFVLPPKTHPVWVQGEGWVTLRFHIALDVYELLKALAPKAVSNKSRVSKALRGGVTVTFVPPLPLDPK